MQLQLLAHELFQIQTLYLVWWTQRSQAIEYEISKSFVRNKKYKKKKTKVFDFVKLEYYKEVLDFRNIEYYITFLNYTNSRLTVPHLRLIEELKFIELEYYLELDFVKLEY